MSDHCRHCNQPNILQDGCACVECLIVRQQHQLCNTCIDSKKCNQCKKIVDVLSCNHRCHACEHLLHVMNATWLQEPIVQEEIASEFCWCSYCGIRFEKHKNNYPNFCCGEYACHDTMLIAVHEDENGVLYPLGPPTPS